MCVAMNIYMTLFILDASLIAMAALIIMNSLQPAESRYGQGRDQRRPVPTLPVP